jgi:hypothetical protein
MIARAKLDLNVAVGQELRDVLRREVLAARVNTTELSLANSVSVPACPATRVPNAPLPTTTWSLPGPAKTVEASERSCTYTKSSPPFATTQRTGAIM